MALIGLLGANVIWLVPSLNDARDSAARLRLEIAKRGADSVNTFIENQINALHNTAGVLRFNENTSSTVLDLFLKEHPEFNTVSLVGADFVEYLNVSRFEILQTGRLRTFPELATMPAADDAFYLSPVSRSQNLEPLIMIAVPVQSAQNGKRKFIIAELNLKPLSEVVTHFHFGTTGKVYIFERKGTLIIDPDISLVLKSPIIEDRPIVRSLLGGEQNVSEATYANENGTQVVASGIFLPQFSWGVVGEQYASEANALPNKILFLAVIAILVGMLLLGALIANARKLFKTNVKLHETLEELARLNDRLKEANGTLKVLDQAKTEFMSIASHQLRAPLTVIKGYLSLALEGTLGVIPKQAKESLGKAAFSTDQLVKLVNELLDISRMEAGKIEYKMAANNLSLIIKEVMDELKPQAEQKKIILKLESQDDLGQFNFDRDKMREVIINLLHNAVKYTQRGEIMVRQQIIGRDGKEYARISVKDNGMGIAKEDIHRLFTKFVRSAQAKEVDVNGMGLGLFFVKKVVEDHGGKAWAESDGLGKGSTFFVEIPFKR